MLMHVAAPSLFLPGSGGRRSFWEPVALRLAATLRGEQRIFAWPGFGDAPADGTIQSLDDLYAWFLARTPPEPSHVVAQSMGGILAMRFALEHPERVRRLVLVTTSGGTRERFGVDWRPGFRAGNPTLPDWFEKDRTDLEDRLGDVRVPTLLVFGDADPIAPVAMGEHLRSRIPGARLVVLAGGTHGLGEERPDEVARAIGEFVAS